MDVAQGGLCGVRLFSIKWSINTLFYSLGNFILHFGRQIQQIIIFINFAQFATEIKKKQNEFLCVISFTTVVTHLMEIIVHVHTSTC
jgi:hypothetical protein